MMSFVSLQENLRRELRKRIDAGELTGMELARRTGFTQAHISNFLNRKRGLKLSALDRMLKAVGLTLYDLLNPHELVRFAAAPAGADEAYADVPVVEAASAARSEVIVNEEVKELVKLPRSLLSRVRADLTAPARKSWTRFVLLRVSPEEALSMRPRLSSGALVLVDRHYTSLHPYRKNEPNLYAARKDDDCTLRYVETTRNLVLLRPHNPESPVEIVTLSEDQSASSLIIGRIAYISSEL